MSRQTGDDGAPGLQSAMAQTWPTLEQTSLGDWVLRAAAGFTNRPTLH